VQDGYLDLRDIKTIVIRRNELPRYLLRDGDVLLTEGGDFDKLGRGFIWRGEVPNCVHQNHVFAVRVDRSILCPEFLAYLVQSSYGRAYFLTVAHKTTNLATINSTKLKALPVPLAPMEEQREIVRILETIDRKIEVHQRKYAVLRELFDTLLHDLMTGRIRVPESLVAAT
jgi:type I restriction enzyme S subunit